MDANTKAQRDTGDATAESEGVSDNLRLNADSSPATRLSSEEKSGDSQADLFGEDGF
jgi:hypothetical protein